MLPRGLPEGAGAPAELKAIEAEITPEMLEAGGDLVEAWDYDSPSLEASTHQALAKLIYCRMRLAALGKYPLPSTGAEN